jgi:hypothetical protein
MNTDQTPTPPPQWDKQKCGYLCGKCQQFFEGTTIHGHTCEPPQTPEPQPGDVGVWERNGLKMEVRFIHNNGLIEELALVDCVTGEQIGYMPEIQWHRLAIVDPKTLLGPECPKCGTIPWRLPPETEKEIKSLFVPTEQAGACGWTLDQTNEEHDTDCGRSFRFIVYGWDGAPGFCPGCGRRVVVREKEEGE